MSLAFSFAMSLLLFINHLKNIELQIITFLRGPQDRMIGRLRVKFHLTKPLVRASGSFTDRLGKELRVHEVGAGAGGEKSAVLDQLQATQIDLTIALDGILGSMS